MRANVWFEIFDGLLEGQNLWYMRGKCDKMEGDLNWAHPFPRVSWYKRGSDIMEGDIMSIGVGD
jgi:hypothetical protein